MLTRSFSRLRHLFISRSQKSGKTRVCLQYEFMKSALLWDRKKTDRRSIMNKVISIAVLAGGLLLLDSPPAAADHEVRNPYQSRALQQSRSHDNGRYHRNKHRRDAYRRDYSDDHRYRGHKSLRRPHMPNWLRNERSFRHWYRHSSLRHNRHLSWHVLFDIYRWKYSRHRYYRY